MESVYHGAFRRKKILSHYNFCLTHLAVAADVESNREPLCAKLQLGEVSPIGGDRICAGRAEAAAGLTS